MEDQKLKRLLVFDANSVIHRAFHALPQLTTSKNEATQAVYGFCLVFLRSIRELKPTYVVAAFDYPAPTFREKTYLEYKAKRPPAPPELYTQIPKTKEVLKAFAVPIFEKEGFEADDIIGTIAKKALRQQAFPKPEIIIISGDADILQLVDKYTKVWLLRRGVKDIFLYDEEEVRRRYNGLAPNQLVDLRALRGDPSDNISGIPGIGEKTAIELLLTFDTLEALYKALEENEERVYKIKPKIRTLLRQGKEQAFLSRDLAKIRCDLELDFKLEDCKWGRFSKNEVKRVFLKFEFTTLINKIPEPIPEN